MFITDSIFYVGVNDHQVDLFEGQYDVPNGMAYNSYVIMDEKIAVMDTVDIHFTEEWLGNVAKVSGWKEARLSGSTAYGARSCSEYLQFHESISGDYRCSKCEDFWHDGEFLP